MTGKSIHLPQHSPCPGGSHNRPSAMIRQLSLTRERKKCNTPAFWKYDKSVFGCLYSASFFLSPFFFFFFLILHWQPTEFSVGHIRVQFRSVQFKIVSGRFSRSTLSCRSFHSVAFETVPVYKHMNGWKTARSKADRHLHLIVHRFNVV